MARPEPNSRPCLTPGCRLNESTQQPRVLHLPERALRLNGPSFEILSRCDGARTVLEIVSELQTLYSKADPQRLEEDVLAYLVQLQDQQALDFLPGEAGRGKEAE